MRVEAGDHGDSGRWVNVPGDDRVEVLNFDLCVEVGKSGVLRIDGPDGSGGLYLAVGGERGTHRKRKGLGQGEVVQPDVEVIVDLEIFLQGQSFHLSAAVFDDDLVDREIR